MWEGGDDNESQIQRESEEDGRGGGGDQAEKDLDKIEVNLTFKGTLVQWKTSLKGRRS